VYDVKLSDRAFGCIFGPRNVRIKDYAVPALSSSVRYDRSAGFFSPALVAAADAVWKKASKR